MSRLEQEILAAGTTMRHEAGEFVKDFIFPIDFVGFLGHFPGQPILPALVQLMAGVLCVREATEARLTPAAVMRAKFLRPIRPNESVCLRLSLASDRDSWQASVRLLVQDEIAASYQITLIRDVRHS